MPGGCNLGARPIDLHIKGFIALGAEVEVRNGFVVAHAPKQRLTGTHIYLDQASVGTTMNLILASAFASGTTIIENAAKEPPYCGFGQLYQRHGRQYHGRRNGHH